MRSSRLFTSERIAAATKAPPKGLPGELENTIQIQLLLEFSLSVFVVFIIDSIQFFFLGTSLSFIASLILDSLSFESANPRFLWGDQAGRSVGFCVVCWPVDRGMFEGVRGVFGCDGNTTNWLSPATGTMCLLM